MIYVAFINYPVKTLRSLTGNFKKDFQINFTAVRQVSAFKKQPHIINNQTDAFFKKHSVMPVRS